MEIRKNVNIRMNRMIASVIRTSLWWLQLCWLFPSFLKINGIIKTILGQRRFGQTLNLISFLEEGKKATHVDVAVYLFYYCIDFTFWLLRIGWCEVRSIHIQNMIQPWNNKSHLLEWRSYFYITIFTTMVPTTQRTHTTTLDYPNAISIHYFFWIGVDNRLTLSLWILY